MGSYLKEINYPSLTESIDEKYDSITSFMPPNAVIYGSALTSLISCLPADGDLDISISPSEYNHLAHGLQKSSKWLQIEGNHVRVSPMFFGTDSTFSHVLKSSKYEEIIDLPMEETVTFQDINGAKIQIIKSKQNSTDPLDDALSVVRKVDFAFCGMAMDKYGRLIESIPHAYSDCCANIIRIANYRVGEDLDIVRDRLKKYLNRGWHLSVSIDTIFDGFRKKLSAEAESTGETLEKDIFKFDSTSSTVRAKIDKLDKICSAKMFRVLLKRYMKITGFHIQGRLEDNRKTLALHISGAHPSGKRECAKWLNHQLRLIQRGA